MRLELGNRDEATRPHARPSSIDGVTGAHEAHAVHFFEDDAHRLSLVSHFVREGQRQGRPVIVIAREALRCALTARLRDGGVPAQGTVTMFGVDELLDTLMVDGAPDARRFEHAMGLLVSSSKLETGGPPPRIYGEMVDVLCERGHAKAALRIEELWNHFVASSGVELLCGYRMDRFRTAADSARFEQVCKLHARVTPTERYRHDESESERDRQIAFLQQRAAALEHELGWRRASEQLIEDAQAVRDDFVVVAGHELRTPLTVIQLQVQYLLRSAEAELPARVQRALALTARGVDRLAMVVEQVLEVSRIEAGRMVLQLGPVDLAAVVRQAVGRLRGEPCDDAKVVVEAEEGLLGRWDFARLDRVVSTLLSNAVKFGGASPVEVVVARSGAMARLSVRDHGVGIAPEDHLRIFARYARGDASIGLGGLGLGLWIARAVVAAHGGTIGVHSTLGEGSTFIVELPLVGGDA